jgi:hypothetical protein
MKRLIYLLFLPLLALVLAACGGASSEEPVAVAVQGPALIMFYTDN